MSCTRDILHLSDTGNPATFVLQRNSIPRFTSKDTTVIKIVQDSCPRTGVLVAELALLVPLMIMIIIIMIMSMG
jgi:hypothetical protein